MRFRSFINNLSKVERERVVVLSWRHHLVQHFFALEQNSATYSLTYIHDTFLNILTMCIQAKHTRMISILVQEDNHTKFAQHHSVKFIIWVMDIRVFMGVVLLLPLWGAIKAIDNNLFLINTQRFVSKFALTFFIEFRFKCRHLLSDFINIWQDRFILPIKSLQP